MSKGEDMVEVVRISGIERGQDGICAMGWNLYGVKIVLLLFQCRYPEQSLPKKITSKILALSKEKNTIPLSQQAICTYLKVTYRAQLLG
jgi:hypothetical protein